MAKIINFQEAVRKKVIDKMMAALGGMNDQARAIANSYYQFMMEDPKSAIKRLPEYLEKARDISPNRHFGESLVGPNHEWTAPMLDIIGTMYPYLEKDVREQGLLRCLSFLDGIKCIYSQDNVALINEPWLVADIRINRYVYWPGYQEYADLLEQNPRWADFSQYISSAKSQFFLALSIIRMKYSSLDVRCNFYKQFPDLVDRTQDAIAAIIYDGAQIVNSRDGTSVDDFIEENILKYDPLFHKNIRAKITEEKWIKLD